MISGAIPVDNQPISSTLFGEAHWLTDFITPENPDIILLWNEITKDANDSQNRAVAAWDWVANEIKYKPFIRASISIEGRSDVQRDFWQMPAMCSRTHVGNCVNKSFLLTSLLRRELNENEVYCVLGNLYNGHPSGHAWVMASLGGRAYILEATRNDVPLLPVENAGRYEPVHYINDKQVLAVPGKTIMTPFSASPCQSNWVRDYIQNGGRE